MTRGLLRVTSAPAKNSERSSTHNQFWDIGSINPRCPAAEKFARTAETGRRPYWRSVFRYVSLLASTVTYRSRYLGLGAPPPKVIFIGALDNDA